MNKSNQHSLPQSLEVAIALWEQHLNEFAVLLSDLFAVKEFIERSYIEDCM